MGNTSQQPRELALVLHDLALRITRFGPTHIGIEPIPGPEVAVLRAVIDHPGSSVSEIAEKLLMQTSNVSTAIRSLVQRTLVDRRTDERDRRVALLYPTARALAERQAIEDAIAATVIAALETVSPQDLRTLLQATPALRTLTRMVGA